MIELVGQTFLSVRIEIREDGQAGMPAYAVERRERIMKLKLLFLVLLTTLLLGAVLAYGQDLSAGPKKARTAEDYKPRTLAEIATTSLVETRGGGSEIGVLTGNLFPSRVQVTYRGSQRAISKARGKIILKWAQRYAGAPEHYTVPYQTELLFQEAGRNHWLVVNENLLARFEKEIKKGTALDLNVIRLGGFKTKGKWEWVLLVESINQRSEVRGQGFFGGSTAVRFISSAKASSRVPRPSRYGFHISSSGPRNWLMPRCHTPNFSA